MSRWMCAGAKQHRRLFRNRSGGQLCSRLSCRPTDSLGSRRCCRLRTSRRWSAKKSVRHLNQSLLVVDDPGWFFVATQWGLQGVLPVGGLNCWKEGYHVRMLTEKADCMRYITAAIETISNVRCEFRTDIQEDETNSKTLNVKRFPLIDTGV